MYLAEVDVNPNIKSFTDALWWSVVTLTTVGYGDIFPVTPEGRLAGAALMVLGITLFAAITGTITSLLVVGQGGGGDPIIRLRELDQLHRDGILTVDEYGAAKAAVLGAITR
jgi:voltage-gated potassium channel Kch